MPVRSAPLCALVLSVLLGAACSAGTPASGGDRSGSTEPAATQTTNRPASTTPTVTSAPLVLVTHPSRPALDLARPVVDELLSGRVSDWADLGSEPGPLALLAATGVEAPGADEVLAAEAVTQAVGRSGAALGVVPASAVGPGVRVVEVAGVHPLRQPTAYGLTTPDDAPPAVTTVSVVGDVMLGRRVGSRMAARGDFAAALRPIAPRLAGADLTIGNLESTLARLGAPRQGNDSFGADPRVRRGLRLAGFDVLSLANNHTGDYGERALRRTVRTLQQSRVQPFGAGDDLAEAAAPAVLEADGTTYAFVGFNAIGETPRALPRSPGALSVRMPIRTGPLQEADLAHVERLVHRAGRTADAVVVLPHWGDQYVHAPLPVQRLVARRLVRAGADLVVGGHPHVVQGMDAVRGVPVLHSLGNFVFDMDFSVPTMQGVVLETTWWDGELKALRLVPYRMDAGSFAPRVVGGAEAAEILGDLRSTSTGPYAG